MGQSISTAAGRRLLLSRCEAKSRAAEATEMPFAGRRALV